MVYRRFTLADFNPADFDPVSGSRPTPQEEAHDVTRAVSLKSAFVQVPPLRFGLAFLERWPIRETPGATHWKQGSYRSTEPAVFILKDVTLHSQAGVLLYGGFVAAETLKHTSPETHGYTRLNKHTVLIDADRARSLSGSYVSLLSGSGSNYFHIIVDCIGRLSALPMELIRSAEGILIPEGDVVLRMLHLLGNEVPVHVVPKGESIRVERLIWPTSVHGEIAFHPCLMTLLHTVAAAVPPLPDPQTGRRIYIDRRRASNRELLNEQELIEALRPFGFLPVILEEFSVDDQIRLFRSAAFVIAPHGAGLTNLAYACPGCLVLELQMDAYINWAFRRFCALLALPYDCIIGRATGPWTDLTPAVHGMKWVVSLPHVLAAVQSLIGETRPFAAFGR